MLVPLASRSLCQATLVSTGSTLMVMVISTYKLCRRCVSITNYLTKQGWQRDQPIGFMARYTGSNRKVSLLKDLTQPTPYGALKIKGFPL